MINWIILVPLAALFLYVVGFWVLAPLGLIPSAVRHFRYTRHGLCPECHKPGTWISRPIDAAYSSRARQLVCPDGHGSIAVGDRRSADWAGF